MRSNQSEAREKAASVLTDIKGNCRSVINFAEKRKKVVSALVDIRSNCHDASRYNEADLQFDTACILKDVGYRPGNDFSQNQYSGSPDVRSRDNGKPDIAILRPGHNFMSTIGELKGPGTKLDTKNNFRQVSQYTSTAIGQQTEALGGLDETFCIGFLFNGEELIAYTNKTNKNQIDRISYLTIDLTTDNGIEQAADFFMSISKDNFEATANKLHGDLKHIDEEKELDGFVEEYKRISSSDENESKNLALLMQRVSEFGAIHADIDLTQKFWDKVECYRRGVTSTSSTPAAVVVVQNDEEEDLLDIYKKPAGTVMGYEHTPGKAMTDAKRELAKAKAAKIKDINGAIGIMERYEHIDDEWEKKVEEEKAAGTYKRYNLPQHTKDFLPPSAHLLHRNKKSSPRYQRITDEDKKTGMYPIGKAFGKGYRILTCDHSIKGFDICNLRLGKHNLKVWRTTVSPEGLEELKKSKGVENLEPIDLGKWDDVKDASDVQFAIMEYFYEATGRDKRVIEVLHDDYPPIYKKTTHKREDGKYDTHENSMRGHWLYEEEYLRYVSGEEYVDELGFVVPKREKWELDEFKSNCVRLVLLGKEGEDPIVVYRREKLTVCDSMGRSKRSAIVLHREFPEVDFNPEQLFFDLGAEKTKKGEAANKKED